MSNLFRNQSIHIPLSSECFLQSRNNFIVQDNPTVENRLAPTSTGLGSTLLPMIGGTYQIDISMRYQEDRIGDVERRCWWMLTSLIQSGLGELEINGIKYWGSVFYSGRAHFYHRSESAVAEMMLSFLYSDSSQEDTYTTADSTPTFTSGNSLNDFTFGGVDMGSISCPTIIEALNVSKTPIVIPIPRSRGVRLRTKQSGGSVVFTLKSWLRGGDTRQDLEQLIVDKFEELSGGKEDLVGNGYTYKNCVVQNFTPQSSDRLERTLPVTYSIGQEI
jgi:hypothetical protein